jgi:NAD(P)-dependent dehydrogenase (short-subunit alcohol dehydrogenase family)
MTETAPVAIITGGSGGLAPGLAAALVHSGCRIVLTARGIDALDRAAGDIAARTGGELTAIASDATDHLSVKALADAVLARFGRIDILVNAAASSTPIGGPVEGINVNALMRDVDTKVGGYLRYAQAVVPAMKAAGTGSIVNIGGLTGRSSDTLSGLRNAAVSHLTKVLADELGPFGIRVNAVHPGIVQTPHLDELFADMAAERGCAVDDIRTQFAADIPTRRILSPDEIGEAVSFLTAPGGTSITGQSITVDGGYSRGIYL